MAALAPGDKVRIIKPPHIFEGVIIMPGSPAEIQAVNADGSYDLLYYDREMMPHTMPGYTTNEIEATGAIS